jgi:acid phosphatase
VKARIAVLVAVLLGVGSFVTVLVLHGKASGRPVTEAPDVQVTTGAAPSATGSAAGPAAGAAAGPVPAHVVVVVMENHGLHSVIGNAQAPWLNSLPGALFTNWHGVRHPSEPNYLALFAGSTKGLVDDRCPLTYTGGNLGSQLLTAGRTFAGYSEGLPKVGSQVCVQYPYARKHNPWADFPNLPASVNRPFTAFSATDGSLPTVSFVIPGLCHDTHDCSVATGDAWQKKELSGYVAWAQTNNSLLIITYDEDEDDSTKANLIPTLFVGQMVTTGTYGTRYDHYSLLRTIEAMYGLPMLNNAATAQTVTGIWK